MVALRQEVLLLRREMATMQRQLREHRRTATVMSQGREAASAPDPRTDPAARAAAERQRQEQLAVIEATFWREPTDRRWANETAEVVQEVLASDDVGQLAVQSLECRSHTCRVDLADDDTGELAKLLPLFGLQLAETLPYVTVNQVVNGNGSTSTILYMSREAPEPPTRK
jgi:hypothetical protein